MEKIIKKFLKSLDKLKYADFVYLTHETLLSYLGKSIGSVPAEEIERMYSTKLIILDLGNGTGMDILTKRVLPIVDAKSEYKVGSKETRVLYETYSHGVSEVDFLNYIDNKNNKFNDIEEDYRETEDAANSYLKEFLNYLAYADIMSPTTKAFETVAGDNSNEFFKKYMQEEYTTKGSFPVIILNPSLLGLGGESEEIKTGKTLPYIDSEFFTYKAFLKKFGTFLVERDDSVTEEDFYRYMSHKKKTIEDAFRVAEEKTHEAKMSYLEGHLDVISKYMDMLAKASAEYKKS